MLDHEIVGYFTKARDKQCDLRKMQNPIVLFLVIEQYLAQSTSQKKVFKVKQSFKISDKKHALMFLLYNIKYIWHNECPLFESVGTWELQYEWQ